MGRMVWLDNTTATKTLSINDGGVVSTAVDDAAVGDAAVDDDAVDDAVVEDAIVEDETMEDAPVAEDDAAMDAEFAERARDCCLLFDNTGSPAK